MAQQCEETKMESHQAPWRYLPSETVEICHLVAAIHSKIRTMIFGGRSFEVSGPTIWIDHPAIMKDPSLSKDSFRKMLKTYLDR